MNNRNLTDDDIQAVANELERRLVSRFYGNLGRGVWDLAWRGILLCIIGVALWGALVEIRGH